MHDEHIYGNTGLYINGCNADWKMRETVLVGEASDAVCLSLACYAWPTSHSLNVVMTEQQALDLYRTMREWALNLHADEREARELAMEAEHPDAARCAMMVDEDWRTEVHGDDEEVN